MSDRQLEQRVEALTREVGSMRRLFEVLIGRINPLGDLLTADEVRRVYGIPRSTLYSLSNPERKPHPLIERRTTTTGQLRFVRDTIERYLSGYVDEPVERRGRPSSYGANAKKGVA